MFSVKSFWSYAIGILIVLLAVIALAIWQSGKNSPVLPNAEPASEAASANATIPKTTSDKRSLPSNLPAPAKKLKTLLTESDQLPVDQAELKQRLKALDKQLAELNKQLKAQGIDLPTQPNDAQQSSSDSSGIDERLRAIEAHLDSR